jgi:hypothetical protein
MRPKLATLLLALALVVPAAGFAATVGGEYLADKTSVNGQTLVLNGGGIRKKFFMKIYIGGLYLPAKQSNAAAVLSSDVPRQQVLDFLFSVTKDQMFDAWKEGLEDNTPNAPAEVRENFKTLCAWMEAIPKGNRMVLTYVPGSGTTVEVNGKAKGTLPGKATADAILATWIGPKPGPGEDFKHAVLGK